MSAANPPAPAGRRTWRKAYLVVGAALLLGSLLAKLVAPAADGATFLVVCTVFWAIPLVFVGVRWLWRKLTYRVGVRLFLSYLLIGIAPFPLMGILAAVAGYIAVGQYASVRFGATFERWQEDLSRLARDAMRGTTAARLAVDTRLLLAASASPPAGLPRIDVLARPSGTAELVFDQGLNPELRAAPEWLRTPSSRQEEWAGIMVTGGKPFLAAYSRNAGAFAAAFLPLDLDTARKAFQGRWFEVRFVSSQKLAQITKSGKGDRPGLTIVRAEPGGSESSGVRLGGEEVPAEQVEKDWLTTRLRGGDWWHRLTIPWARPFATPRSWQTGVDSPHWRAFTLIKTSVAGALEDFLASPRPLGREISLVLRATGAFFGFCYLIAVAFAAVMILRVTRSTARLTRGARAIARGDLDYRIAVKRHDQLGELAVAFNSMTDSIRSMLIQVAEKERMAREMELAREIQTSLLPPSELSSGPLAVVAYFRPAAEVGGDYFDLFPLAPGRLTVAIGDVAGHGLPTGLLMAMVKSAVAALIEEGYRGGELLSRLNHLLLGQSLRQKMVSFALAEIDASTEIVEITSAGHPPGVLLAADGGVEEVLLSSLPLGHRWPDPPPRQARPFPPGSRLLLYSDGLVEARNAAGEAFGYEALKSVLFKHRDVPARGLLNALLAELDLHLGGQLLADDLTVLLVEHLPVRA